MPLSVAGLDHDVRSRLSLRRQLPAAPRMQLQPGTMRVRRLIAMLTLLLAGVENTPSQQEQMVVAMEAAMEAPEAGQAGACYKPDTRRFSFSNMLKANQLPRDPFDNIDMARAWQMAKIQAERDAAKVQAPAPKKRARSSAPERGPPPLQVFARKFLDK